MQRSSGLGRPGLVLLAIAVTSLLGGCDQMPVAAGVGQGDIRNAIARGQMASPRAATVALASLEGAPDSVAARFRQMLASDAAAREVAITDEASARYLVRGYLAAYQDESGVTLSYVYDLYDAGQKRREQRIEDMLQVPGAGGDPWAAVNDTVLQSLVARSADELATALAGTPEAQASKVASASPPPAQ